MKEAYIETALKTGESWNLLSKGIQRSINVINNLLNLLQLHFLDDIAPNEIAESVVSSSNYIVINNYSRRIYKLSEELITLITCFNKQHISDVERVIKWINDEYSAINHFNFNKDDRFSNIKRTQILYNSLKLSTLIKSNYNTILNSVTIIKDNIDNFIQYKLSRQSDIFLNSQQNFRNIIEHFTKFSTLIVYTGDLEINLIRNYIES